MIKNHSNKFFGDLSFFQTQRWCRRCSHFFYAENVKWSFYLSDPKMWVLLFLLSFETCPKHVWDNAAIICTQVTGPPVCFHGNHWLSRFGYQLLSLCPLHPAVCVCVLRWLWVSSRCLCSGAERSQLQSASHTGNPCFGFAARERLCVTFDIYGKMWCNLLYIKATVCGQRHVGKPLEILLSENAETKTPGWFTSQPVAVLDVARSFLWWRCFMNVPVWAICDVSLWLLC